MSCENKALLLSGPQHYDQRRPITRHSREFAENINPLGIAIVAAVAKEHGLDLTWQSMDPSGRKDLRDVLENVGTLFISSRYLDTDLAVPIIRMAKSAGKKVVVGGYGPTFSPEAFGDADAIVKGEFEPVADQLMDDLRSGRLETVYDATSMPPHDIEKNYIWPDRTIFPEWKGLFKRLQLHPQEWQRGCPNSCSFCSPTRMQSPVREGKKTSIRVRSIPDVIAEIESVNLEPGDNLFSTDLNTSAIPPEELRELFGYLGRSGIRWYSEGTVAPLLADLKKYGTNGSLLQTMSPRNGIGGCYSFLYGADDLDAERVTGSLDKNIGCMEEAVREFRRFGIPLNLSVVVGLDSHTYPKSFFTFAQVLEEVNPPHTFVHLATPYMSTPWGDKVKREGRIIDTESTHYNHRQAVHKPLNMTSDQLQQGYYWLMRQLNSPDAINKSVRKNSFSGPSRRDPFLDAIQSGILWRVETYFEVLELQSRGYLDIKMQKELDDGYKRFLKNN